MADALDYLIQKLKLDGKFASRFEQDPLHDPDGNASFTQLEPDEFLDALAEADNQQAVDIVIDQITGGRMDEPTDMNMSEEDAEKASSFLGLASIANPRRLARAFNIFREENVRRNRAPGHEGEFTFKGVAMPDAVRKALQESEELQRVRKVKAQLEDELDKFPKEQRLKTRYAEISAYETDVIEDIYDKFTPVIGGGDAPEWRKVGSNYYKGDWEIKSHMNRPGLAQSRWEIRHKDAPGKKAGADSLGGAKSRIDNGELVAWKGNLVHPNVIPDSPGEDEPPSTGEQTELPGVGLVADVQKFLEESTPAELREAADGVDAQWLKDLFLAKAAEKEGPTDDLAEAVAHIMAPWKDTTYPSQGKEKKGWRPSDDEVRLVMDHLKMTVGGRGPVGLRSASEDWDGDWEALPPHLQRNILSNYAGNSEFKELFNAQRPGEDFNAYMAPGEPIPQPPKVYEGNDLADWLGNLGWTPKVQFTANLLTAEGVKEIKKDNWGWYGYTPQEERTRYRAGVRAGIKWTTGQSGKMTVKFDKDTDVVTSVTIEQPPTTNWYLNWEGGGTRIIPEQQKFEEAVRQVGQMVYNDMYKRDPELFDDWGRATAALSEEQIQQRARLKEREVELGREVAKEARILEESIATVALFGPDSPEGKEAMKQDINARTRMRRASLQRKDVQNEISKMQPDYAMNFYRRFSALYKETLGRLGVELGIDTPVSGNKDTVAASEEAKAVLPKAWSWTKPVTIRQTKGRGSWSGWGDRIKTSSRGRRYGGFNAVTLHEWVHSTEGNNWYLSNLEREFWERRTNVGEKLTQLRRLSPGSNYRADEEADPDEFFDAYVGKVYSDEYWELMTMGTQYMFYPGLGANWSGEWTPPGANTWEDHDFRNFILGALATARPRKAEVE